MLLVVGGYVVSGSEVMLLVVGGYVVSGRRLCC